MRELFGELPNGNVAHLYTISNGQLHAKITDLGATLVSLYVPDKNGELSDVVLGYDSPDGYLKGTAYLGATIGRTANRIRRRPGSIQRSKGNEITECFFCIW